MDQGPTGMQGVSFDEGDKGKSISISAHMF
jgi:hypothetical protein